MDKVKTKVRAKVGKDITVEQMTASVAVSRYIELSVKEKEIEKEKNEIKEWVKANAKIGIEISSDEGTFKVIKANKWQWSLKALKEMFGKQWTDFVTTDNSLVAAKIESVGKNDPDMASSMFGYGTVTVIEQVKLLKN